MQLRERGEALASDLHRPTTGQLELLARRRQTDPGRLIEFKAQVQIRRGITALGNFTELPVTTIRLAIQGSSEALQLQPQHRLPLPQAGQGGEMNAQALNLDRGAIAADRRDGGLAQRHTPRPQSLVRPEREGVTEGGAETAFQRPTQRAKHLLSGAVQALHGHNGSNTDSGTGDEDQRTGQPPRFSHQPRRLPPELAQYKETFPGRPVAMALDQLLLTAAPWLAWSGLGLGGLTIVAFLAGWGLRFRLVGVSSFTLLLAVSSWAFAVSYQPPVVVDGAIRAPIVFDNGNDLVVAQVKPNLDPITVEATLEQLAGNLRGSGRGSNVVTVRLRALQPMADGVSQPVILGETERDFRRSAS